MHSKNGAGLLGRYKAPRPEQWQNRHYVIMWLVQATTDPCHWIFQMHHGDVLITQETNDVRAKAVTAAGVVASEKTLQTWKGKVNLGASGHEVHPWLYRDPSQGHSAPAREWSVGHVVSTQAIDRKIKEATPSGDDDMHAWYAWQDWLAGIPNAPVIE